MVALRERRSEPSERYLREVDRLIRQRDRLTNEQVKAALELLDAIRRELIDDLSRIPVDDGKWAASWLRQLRGQVDEATAQIMQRAGPAVRAAQQGAWSAGAEFAPTGLGGAGVQLGIGATSGISIEQLIVAQQLAADLVTRVSRDFQVKANREVTLAVTGARSPWQAQAAVRELLRTQPDRVTKQLGNIPAQAERIVRTEMMSAFSLANDIRSAQIADAVPGLRKWWKAPTDSRTRPAHRAAMARYRPGGSEGPIPHDAEFVVDGERCRGPHDPRLSAGNIINCRCVRLDWMPEWGV